MGGKSKSSTSSTTNNTSQNTNIDGDDVVAVIGSEGVNITTTDFGAIDSAFDFGEKSLDEAFGFGEKSLDEAFDFGDKALDANRKTTDSAFKFSDKVLGKAFEFGDGVLDSNKDVIKSTRSIIGDQVDAIKGLAESLKVGEQKSSKKIALALVAGLVVMALVFLFVMLRK